MMTEEPAHSDLDAFLGTPADAPWRRRAIWGGAVVLLLLLLLLLARCVTSSGQSGYITQEVTRGNLAVSVSATGNLAPTNQVEVGSEVSGTISRVLVDFNDKVVKGQTLAIIDTQLLDDAFRQSQATLAARKADVAQANATVAESQAALDRLTEVKRLSGGKVPAKTEMESAIAARDRAVASLKSAEANVVAAQADLSSNATRREKALIRAPVTGVVLSRKIEPGQTVASSFNTPTLFILAESLTSMQLEVAIDEADVGQVKAGQNATFTVDAYPGEIFPALIKRVNVGSNSLSSTSSSSSSSSTASTSSGSSTVIAYDAILTVNNRDGRLRPGMTATADISVNSVRNALLVPNSAFRFTPNAAAKSQKSEGLMTSMAPRPPGGRRNVEQERKIGVGSTQTVYILDGAQPRAIKVVTGASDGRVTAIRSKELEPGMEVITGQRAAAE